VTERPSMKKPRQEYNVLEEGVPGAHSTKKEQTIRRARTPPRGKSAAGGSPFSSHRRDESLGKGEIPLAYLKACKRAQKSP